MGSSGAAPWAGSPVARRRPKVAKSPSRWKLAHPTVSFRATEVQKEYLRRTRAEMGRPLGDLVCDGLRGARASYWLGYRTGYARGAADEFVRPIPIIVPCRLCGALFPGNAKDPAFQRWLRQGANGGHPGCSGGTKGDSTP